MDAYAIIQTGGKQYRVTQGATLEVELLGAEPGQDVAVAEVLAVSDGQTLRIGKPYVEDVKVVLNVASLIRGEKVINFKKRRRKGYSRRMGHRQELAVVTVASITQPGATTPKE
jgi:large subunit ribosomal protein L21